MIGMIGMASDEHKIYSAFNFVRPSHPKKGQTAIVDEKHNIDLKRPILEQNDVESMVEEKEDPDYVIQDNQVVSEAANTTDYNKKTIEMETEDDGGEGSVSADTEEIEPRPVSQMLSAKKVARSLAESNSAKTAEYVAAFESCAPPPQKTISLIDVKIDVIGNRLHRLGPVCRQLMFNITNPKTDN